MSQKNKVLAVSIGLMVSVLILAAGSSVFIIGVFDNNALVPDGTRTDPPSARSEKGSTEVAEGGSQSIPDDEVQDHPPANKELIRRVHQVCIDTTQTALADLAKRKALVREFSDRLKQLERSENGRKIRDAGLIPELATLVQKHDPYDALTDELGYELELRSCMEIT